MTTSSNLISVKVNLADGTSYNTSVNAGCSDDMIRAYFVGQMLNMGPVEDNLIRCESVEITR